MSYKDNLLDWSRNIMLISRLKAENEQLREALEYSHARDYHCVFCENDLNEHKQDCKYIRLIGGKNKS